MPYRLANVAGRAALVEGDNYYDVESVSEGTLGSDPMDAVINSDRLAELAAKVDGFTPTGKLRDVALGPPVPRPSNCFAVGLNYRNHAEEANFDIPRVPMVFTKYPSSLAGPSDDVVIRSDMCDFEAELVVVIGRGGKEIAAKDAWDHVAGLTVGQDFSDRAAQFSQTPPQFNLGKSFDTFGPIGPVLVSPDALEDPSSLPIECIVDEEVRQSDNTGDLIFDIPYLIEFLSGICTLQSGDLIFTGTPGGVGVAEGRFLAEGALVTTTIKGIGTLRNRCVRGPDHAHAGFVPPGMQKMIEERRAART